MKMAVSTITVALVLITTGCAPGFFRSVQMIRSGGLTPLIGAVQQRDIQKAKSLLDGGADVNARTSFTGITALHEASAQGHVPLVKLLLERGADVNAKSTNSVATTPLDEAAAKGHTEIVKLLIENGAHLGACPSNSCMASRW